MFSIGKNEAEDLPEIGKTVECWMCGKTHTVKYGERVLKDGSKEPCTMLAFFNCGKKSYLCGIDGKDIRPKLKITERTK